MLTPTPLMGLLRWQATDEFDVNEVNANSDTLDANVQTRVQFCTAASRPVTNLYAGKLIYEDDTDRLFMWDGTAWTFVTAGDSGVLTNVVAVSAGWSLQDQQFCSRSSIATLYLLFTRTGANIVAGADGNIANSTVASITLAKWRPIIPVAGSSVSTGYNVGGYIDPTGVVGINTAPPSTTITTGAQLTLAFTYVTNQ